MIPTIGRQPGAMEETVFRQSAILVILPAILLVGCERKPDGAPLAAGVAPSTGPATVPPVTQPARPPSFITIERQPYEFPPARLSVQARDGKVSALLFSDDPRDAINRGYLGHSYYLPMNLDIGSVEELPDAVWSFRSSVSESGDSNAGIFLEGDRVQLVPVDVQVSFEPLDERELVVILRGGFRWKDDDHAAAPRIVGVSARLAAEVKAR